MSEAHDLGGAQHDLHNLKWSQFPAGQTLSLDTSQGKSHELCSHLVLCREHELVPPRSKVWDHQSNHSNRAEKHSLGYLLNWLVLCLLFHDLLDVCLEFSGLRIFV